MPTCVDKKQIRAYRLTAHHLDQKYPLERLLDAAAVCGLQNSPPGTWEIALHNRLRDCSSQVLYDALHVRKSLLQAWSLRGAPLIFPTAQSAVFLSALIAQSGEDPWIYTRGITTALDFLEMSFDDVLARLKRVILTLDEHTVKGKDALDKCLAAMVSEDLTTEKQALWSAPSMYGKPEKQCVGEAVVSFLLRPCALYGQVVFGERQGNTPTFTSFKNWTGHPLQWTEEADVELVRKFLHSYGPSTQEHFMHWLGCSAAQAHRLWTKVRPEMVEVVAEGKCGAVLEADLPLLFSKKIDEERMLLLGAHDPYLGLYDRTTILEDKARHQEVWKTVGNPGVVLQGGRIIGTWKSHTVRKRMELFVQVWKPVDAQVIERIATELATYRKLELCLNYI